MDFPDIKYIIAGIPTQLMII